MAWQFYFTAAMWSLAVGAAAGFVAQYAVLVYWGSTEDLPEFLAIALVPGVRYSRVYTHFDQNRRIMLACDEQLARIAAKEEMTKAQIRLAHNAVVMKLRAVASLEDFSHARLLDLAEEELSRIVSASEEKAKRSGSSSRATRRLDLVCPKCKGRVRYKGNNAARESVPCPRQCGWHIKLPPPLPHDRYPDSISSNEEE